MAAKPIRLGPFELRSLIGRGGMAEVWRAEHVARKVPVAVKVVTASRARELHHRASFRNEVQAVARLNHRSIVLVLDYGEVSFEAERASEGQLTEGSPYLAMELASWGSLDRVRAPLPFPDLLRILGALLEALAHAHARGVIHRDLKPSNVLLASPADMRPGLKLTDFGIAHALESDRIGDDVASGGTPHYMAPEQFLGRWRDYGPWTDLYAVGCLAYVLATGRLPFTGEAAMQLAYAHLNLPPPKLELDASVPRGFSAWINRLLQKDPRDRFQRAADAAWALTQMTGDRTKRIVSIPRTIVSEEIPEDELATLVNATRMGLTLPWFAEERRARSTLDAGRKSGDETLALRPLPPLPRTWRRPDDDDPPIQLVGAGLGLYGLRTIPMIDRDLERDEIWRALRDVRETRSPRAIAIFGAAGVGKSRLVEWMTQRADEVGSALVLKAVHSPIPGPGDGLERMVARHLRVLEMPRREALERMERMLRAQGVSDEYEWHALTEFVQPAIGPERTVQFTNAIERHVLVIRLIEHLARERPVIVWLDDVQWSGDSIAFAKRLIDTAVGSILCLLTVRSEALDDRPIELAAMSELLQQVGVRSLRLSALSREDQKKLVNELLVLDDRLASEVANRTDGNPLFAVQLVGDWVQRGVLEASESGFVLERSERAELPDDIHQLWRRRINRAIASRGERAEIALELAAILGVNVDDREWAYACDEAGIDGFEDLPDVLIATRLALPSESGWTFAHAMLRESLVRTAHEQGRSIEHHRACARMLQRRYGLEVRGIPDRLGNHLVEAGDLEDALDPLLLAALERIETSQYREAEAVIERRNQVLTWLGAEDADERRGENWVLLARVATMQGRFDEAHELAGRAERLARRWGWRAVLPEALEVIGTIAHERGDREAAIDAFTKAKDLYEWNGDGIGVADCLFGLGEAMLKLGRDDRAEAYHVEGLLLAESEGNVRGMAKHLLGIGFVQLSRGDTGGARESFQRELALLEGLGNRFRIAQCLSALGTVARRAGDLETAERQYRRALTIDEAIGSNRAWMDRLDVALVLLARGEYREAREMIEEVRRRLGNAAEPVQEIRLHIGLLPCLAASGEWAAWDRHFAAANRLLRETRLEDREVAWLLVVAGQRARAAGDPVRARHSYELAIRQWQALGRADKAEEVEEAIDLLRSGSF